jgi:hypothetical protein
VESEKKADDRRSLNGSSAENKERNKEEGGEERKREKPFVLLGMGDPGAEWE